MAPYRETRIFSYSFQSDFIPQAGEFNRNQYHVAVWPTINLGQKRPLPRPEPEHCPEHCRAALKFG